MKRFFYLLPLVLFIAGCQNINSDLQYEASDSTVPHVISLSPTIPTFSSRVSRSAMETGFAANDSIGMFMLVRSVSDNPASFTSFTGNYIDNALFYYTAANTWKSTTINYWKDGNSIFDVYAYYPHVSDLSTATGSSIPYTLSTDQSTIAKLRQADLLYGVASNLTYNTNATSIPIVMKHKMCKITCTFDVGSIDLSTAVFSVTKVCNTGSLSLSDGAITTSTKLTTITPYYDSAKKSIECIVAPQSLASGTQIFTLRYKEASGGVYSLIYAIDSKLTMESGKEYLFSFKYSASTPVISLLTVKDMNK